MERAYREMNEFEAELRRWGAVIVKFWVDVDKDEQLKRFKEREENPQKRWKITDEDWRNRENGNCMNQQLMKCSAEQQQRLPNGQFLNRMISYMQELKLWRLLFQR